MQYTENSNQTGISDHVFSVGDRSCDNSICRDNNITSSAIIPEITNNDHHRHHLTSSTQHHPHHLYHLHRSHLLHPSHKGNKRTPQQSL